MTYKYKQKPIIRWAGSKRKLIPSLLKHRPSNFNKYIEPFCGSACFFFELSPESAILGDFNPELINALKILRREPKLVDIVRKIPKDKEVYYQLRNLDIDKLDSVRRAFRFLYLNRYCFNGVYRTNLDGNFNVPFGSKTGDFPKLEVFEAASEKLKKAVLVCDDYKTTLTKAMPNDFAYIDPPYSKKEHYTGQYGTNAFTSSKLDDFSETLKNLDSRNVKFLVSYEDSEQIRSIIKNDYIIIDTKVMRHVSGYKNKWIKTKEILIKNYEK